MARKVWIPVALLLVALYFLAPTCRITDRGLAKLEVEEELRLGMPLNEVKARWYQYSKKPLVFDRAMSDEKVIAYRGMNRDESVNSFYLRFDLKRNLREVEWRYRPSMTSEKEQQLLELWTQRLWKPSLRIGFEGTTFYWADRKAVLELYVSSGICNLIHRLQ